jgi:hypothetical protein
VGTAHGLPSGAAIVMVAVYITSKVALPEFHALRAVSGNIVDATVGPDGFAWAGWYILETWKVDSSRHPDGTRLG